MTHAHSRDCDMEPVATSNTTTPLALGLPGVTNTASHLPDPRLAVAPEPSRGSHGQAAAVSVEESVPPPPYTRIVRRRRQVSPSSSSSSSSDEPSVVITTTRGRRPPGTPYIPPSRKLLILRRLLNEFFEGISDSLRNGGRGSAPGWAIFEGAQLLIDSTNDLIASGSTSLTRSLADIMRDLREAHRNHGYGRFFRSLPLLEESSSSSVPFPPPLLIHQYPLSVPFSFPSLPPRPRAT
ncbi:hypothetical protein BCR35DRAFT_314760 [Leucosporidium creatinivorum]|uniref:Uncharacterized protein n=1 Tax=Leucosporidium creatinivorum TaxID=106004 RepID=A0A1Y2EUD5_9BASI|nr:hypothetical protein BCR35DRAFT_314760 [Leucosporidium creatinivorum]